MKKNIKARVVGYLTIIAMGLVISVLVQKMVFALRNPSRLISIHFAEMGSLMVDDPVVKQGVSIGRVRDIKTNPNNSLQSHVVIELYGRGFIPSDSRFVDFNHSMMGARSIILVPGQSNIPLDEKQVHEGFFAPGFTETLHKVDALLKLVVTVRNETARLFVDPKSPWSPEQLPYKLDQSIASIKKLTSQTNQAAMIVNQAATQLIQTGQSARKKVQKLNSASKSIESRIESALSLVLVAEKDAESVLKLGEQFLKNLQDSGMVRNLLSETTLYDGLESALTLLESALRLLRTDGLKDIIHYPRNVHLIEGKSR